MANLYLTEQGSVLKKTGDRLIVQKEGELLLDVQCSKIEAVLVFGNVQVTTQAIRELFEHGIELALLTKSGRLIGQLTSPATKNIELRLAQFKRYEDEDFRLRLAKALVCGKFVNCLHTIKSFAANHTAKDFSSEITGMEGALEAARGADSVAVLRGIEGNAARIYFGGFGKMILGDFMFEGRKKHPSTDPVNALLSFGYTLIFNEISSLLDGLGFDPYLGYFHEVEYGRASLAADIQEEFRASVDRFTLFLINNRMLCSMDFYRNDKDGSMYLKREAMKKYFAEYEKFLSREFRHPETGDATTMRKCFRIQAEKLAGYIKGRGEYKAFMPED